MIIISIIIIECVFFVCAVFLWWMFLCIVSYRIIHLWIYMYSLGLMLLLLLMLFFSLSLSALFIPSSKTHNSLIIIMSDFDYYTTITTRFLFISLRVYIIYTSFFVVLLYIFIIIITYISDFDIYGRSNAALILS